MLHKRWLDARRWMLLAGIATFGPMIGVLGTLAGASAAALPPGCSQSGQTVTCTYSSGSNAFTVPAGVSQVDVVAVGGMGGGFNFSPFGISGYGAVVSGDLPVTAGSTLYAVVNTGGAGGSGFGGSGGGASDVRSSQNDLSSRLIVAGGGGGGGGAGQAADTFVGVGGAGGAADANGGGGGSGGGGGGRGGSSTSGGAGGAAGTCATTSSPICGSATPAAGGGTGASGIGGGGGAGALLNDPFPLNAGGGGGGGGGGGWFGGGGGGGGAITTGGGGGGGGSNLVPTGGSQSIDTTGVPMVQISYKLAPTSEAQCKHDGWRNFLQFKNQAECVAFVRHAAISTCLAERASIGRAAFRDKYGVGRPRRHALRDCVQLHGG
jgi:hypothetical protein